MQTYEDTMTAALQHAFPAVEWTVDMQHGEAGSADGRDRRADPQFAMLAAFNTADGVDLSLFVEGVELEGEGRTVVEAKAALGHHARRLLDYLALLGVPVPDPDGTGTGRVEEKRCPKTIDLPLATPAEARRLGMPVATQIGTFDAVTHQHRAMQQDLRKTAARLRQDLDALDGPLDACRALTEPKG